MKRMLLLIIALCLCSQISLAKEITITLGLNDGSEVVGEELSCSNGVYRVLTDSGIVEVKSNDVESVSHEYKYTWDDLGIKKEDVQNAIEQLNDRLENYSGNQSEEEYNYSDYQNESYEEELNDSDYQNENYNEESNDSDYQNESFEEESNDYD